MHAPWVAQEPAELDEATIAATHGSYADAGPLQGEETVKLKAPAGPGRHGVRHQASGVLSMDL